MAILVSATAVVNVITHALEMPLSVWLSGTIEAYKALFYPIANATLGWIFDLFNIKLTDGMRDCAVFYSLGYTAFFRVILSFLRFKESSNAGDKYKIAALSSILSIFWPIPFLVLAQGDALFLAALEAKKGNKDAADFIQLNNDLMREILFVFLIVAAAMLLNAAGVLN